MILFKCPTCGTTFTIEDGTTTAECLNCGAKHTIETEIKSPSETKKTDPLIRRCKLLIEDREFDKAAELCDEYLNENPEDAEAYELLFLCDIKNPGYKLNHNSMWETNPNYIKIMRFGSDETKAKYEKLKEDYYKEQKISNNPELEALPDGTYTFTGRFETANILLSDYYIKCRNSMKKSIFTFEKMKNFRVKTVDTGLYEFCLFGKEYELGTNEVFLHQETRNNLESFARDVIKRIKLSGNTTCTFDGDIAGPIGDPEGYAKKMEEERAKNPEPTPPPVPAPVKKASAGCYVATCVYGSYDCPEVWTLRRYRDNKLASTAPGRLFIKTYYRISPTLVKWFGNTAWFKKLFKGRLDRMVEKLNKEGVDNTPYDDKEW